MKQMYDKYCLHFAVLKSRLLRDWVAADQTRLSTPFGGSKDGASLLDTTSLRLRLASLIFHDYSPSKLQKSLLLSTQDKAQDRKAVWFDGKPL